MSGSLGNWCLIESDPGVFTELIQKFGVTGVQVEELWSLEEEQFDKLEFVHGLIFLFKWPKDDDNSIQGNLLSEFESKELFFAKQVIHNACATQAILSVLLNSKNINLGSTLSNFKEFSSSFDSSMKGLSLSNSEEIRSVHNSFAKQSLFEFDGSSESKNDDVYHFISYIPFENRCYELDGLKDGPIDHGPVDSNWLQFVRPIIEKRISKYTAGEIHFNLMAIIQDKLETYNSQLQIHQMSNNEGEILRIHELIRLEEVRRKNWRLENIRRRHNYLPFIIELLKTLASQKKLLPLYERAKDNLKNETQESRDNNKTLE